MANPDMAIYIIVGLAFLVAIIALVFASIAYSSLSARFQRVAKIEAYLYNREQNGGGPVPGALWRDTFEVVVNPGTSATIATIGDADLAITYGTPLTLSIKARVGNHTVRPSSTVSFSGSSRSMIWARNGSTGEGLIQFSATQLNTPESIVVVNTGTVPIVVTQASIRLRGPERRVRFASTTPRKVSTPRRSRTGFRSSRIARWLKL